ncbi:MAG TPA: CDP-glycerol glycerophosphotransferase family protein [Propionicimonas sp.]|nr:CDP-glycerol glycerophosphotransferase family protein [Propionicimonas sp.]HQA77847.1 CDP-glycerol glycerophosphotransferase family protein [Propionicimonas sp.]HQD96879.1 CDP-glycerol glycerophosphotransferase family protein [Propionicimonas sp.]
MAPKYNRLETLIRRTRRSRFAFLYTGYLSGRKAYRAVVNRFTGKQVGWVAWMQSGRWVGTTSFELVGWAYERGTGSNDVVPTVTVTCTNDRTKQKIRAKATQRYDAAANIRARLMPVDYGNYAFVATLDLASALAGEIGDSWTVRVTVDDTERKLTGTLKNRAKTAAGAFLVARTAGDRQLEPVWTGKETGLKFLLRQPPVVAETASFDGERVELVVLAPEFEVARAALVEADKAPLAVESLGAGRYRLSATLATPTAVANVAEPDLEKNNPEDLGASLAVHDWLVQVWDSAGNKATVASGLDERDAEWTPGQARYAYTGPGSALLIRDTAAMLLVDDVELVDEPLSLRYTGHALGRLEGAKLVLTGPRQDLEVELTIDGDRFTAVAPLLISAWGGPKLPPQTGAYVLRGRTAAGAWLRVGATSALIQRTPLRTMGELIKLRVGVASGRRVTCLFSAPLQDQLVGDYQQARLKAEYHARTFEPQEAVYFESFNGRAATCNTYALDREVARRFPELKRYWSVLDYSVAVPEGAIPVLKGTLQWWDVRSTCRYIITNEWIRQKFKHQPFQVVLQTWHGSMFKRIGLDRPNFSKDEQTFLAYERVKWDVLLSQNAHSTAIFRSAYAWDGPIWEEGYPRNDDMSTKSGEPIRELLGIRPDQKAVLYAPTWRDDAEETLVDFLDLPDMARKLGDDYVILLRGHSRTLRTDGNVRVPGVIDVTSYPNVTDLFLAADMMITDYSSVMFDYSVTGRPMIFFVPDLEQYRDQTRGVYFDLEETAPGPVLFTQDAVVAAIRNAESDAPGYAEKYVAWREKFNAHDDGHSAERVIERLFALPKK